MNKNKQNLQKYWSAGLGLLFIFGAALSFFVTYKAGCVGDLKSGSHGDPIRSLELENLGFLLMFFSAILGAMAIYLSLKSNHRVAYGIAFALFSLFCLWFVGMQFEVWGIQSCF
jgi:hypothetical protein